MLFLHGIFGTGGNWRSFARKLCAARPRWGAVLVDLRKHGGSQGSELAPPHTLAACAGDLEELERALPGPVRGVLGHSFGGKVALAYVRARGTRPGLPHAFIVDSAPGARPGGRGSEDVLRLADALDAAAQAEYPSREAFVERLRGAGFSRELAGWQAMNLQAAVGGGGHFVFPLDLEALRELLADYFRQDLWPVVEAPPPGTTIHLLRGARSNVLSPEDQERARRLAALPGARVRYHVIADAGHFVHVDQPQRLLDLVCAAT